MEYKVNTFSRLKGRIMEILHEKEIPFEVWSEIEDAMDEYKSHTDEKSREMMLIAQSFM